MRRGLLLLATVAFAAAVPPFAWPAQTSVRIVSRPDGSVARASAWVDAVLTHTPGAHDAAIDEVSDWSQDQVDNLQVELAAIRTLMRDPFAKAFPLPIEFDRGRTAEIRYSRQERERLDRAAARIKAQDLSEHDYLARAIVLHSDVAMLGDRAGNVLRGSDGERMRLDRTGADHWRAARVLAASLDAKAGRDADLALWYRATLAWMIRQQYWNPAHEDAALRRFPGDAWISYLAGCLHEALAAPRTQASLAATRIPGEIRLRVDDPDDELDRAASLLKRAIDREPQLTDARIHYGRVLTAIGRTDAAVIELRRATGEAVTVRQHYYAAMFLGDALERSRQWDAARVAYQSAADRVPQAQAPRLALSQLAVATGQHDAAAVALEPLLALRTEEDQRADPWWTYFMSAGESADALLQEAYMRLTGPPAAAPVLQLERGLARPLAAAVLPHERGLARPPAAAPVLQTP